MGVDPQRIDKLSKSCEKEQASADPQVLINRGRAIKLCHSEGKESCLRLLLLGTLNYVH